MKRPSLRGHARYDARRDHDSTMDHDHAATEDAIDIAIERTTEAQRRAEREIGESGAPSEPTAETVVRRAEDVRVLVDESDPPPSV